MAKSVEQQTQAIEARQGFVGALKAEVEEV
jgi:hypothetical protein